MPLYNEDGTPYTFAARYTPLDPRIAVRCTGCRYHAHHKCIGTVTIEGGDMAGTYRCDCLRCSVMGVAP